MRAVRARIFALLAALVLLLPGGASARAQYYCQMMGQVVASCCCAAEAAQARDPAQELRVADCCQRISSAVRGAVPGTREALHSAAVAALFRTVPEPVRASAPAAPVSSCTEATQAPLAIGPPLFVVHCALLS